MTALLEKIDLYSIYFAGIMINLFFALVFVILFFSSKTLKKPVSFFMLSFASLFASILFSALRDIINFDLSIVSNNLLTVLAYISIAKGFMVLYRIPHEKSIYYALLVSVIPPILYLALDLGLEHRIYNYSLATLIIIGYTFFKLWNNRSDRNVKLILGTYFLIVVTTLYRIFITFNGNIPDKFMQSNDAHTLVIIIIFILTLSLGVLMLSGLTLIRLDREKQTSLKSHLLMNEMNHRIANSLNRLISLLEIQRIESDNNSDAKKLADVQGRLFAISEIHKQLYSNSKPNAIEMNSYLRDIVNMILSSFDKKDIKVHFNVLYSHLNPDQGMFVGIIVNELLINSCKHAFQDSKKNEIAIELKTVDDNASKPTYELSYSDSGDLNKPPENKGIGSTIIDSVITNLEAKSFVKYVNGFQFKMKFIANAVEDNISSSSK